MSRSDGINFSQEIARRPKGYFLAIRASEMVIICELIRQPFYYSEFSKILSVTVCSGRNRRFRYVANA